MSTTRTLSQQYPIGAPVNVRVDANSTGQGWIVPCRVIDSRTVYGRTQLRVKPERPVIAAAAWIDENRVSSPETMHARTVALEQDAAERAAGDVPACACCGKTPLDIAPGLAHRIRRTNGALVCYLEKQGSPAAILAQGIALP